MGWLTKWFKTEKEETDRTMKYLIVGLGNIGNEYATRGTMLVLVVEALAEHLGATSQETAGMGRWRRPVLKAGNYGCSNPIPI